MRSEARRTAVGCVALAAALTATVALAQEADQTPDGHAVPLFMSAADPTRTGFVRIVNHSTRAGEVSIEAYDDEGQQLGPVVLSVDANEAVHVNSADLENGNPGKGLSGSTGPGEGDWRLVLTSGLDIEVLAYIRTTDGFLTAMHDTVSGDDGRHDVAFFNPGSNLDQESQLRLSNPGATSADVSVTGIDDAGRSPGTGVSVSIPAGESRTYTAAELETGTGVGLEGSLGDGAGKWRLTVESAQEILAMSLLSSGTGHLTNLSTVPGNDTDTHRVPLFPAASDPNGRQGFVRVINRSDTAGSVSIRAFDDTDRTYETLTLAIDANAAKHFNSADLETGAAGKGLDGSTGVGEGDWRLELTSDLDLDVLSYIRTTDGFLTPMHDTVPPEGTRHRVAVFNPGSNANQASRLRLVNDGTETAEVTVAGVDDDGTSSASTVSVSVPPRTARTLTAQELEAGAVGFDGQLGEGAGKWRLTVESTQPVTVMSLLSSPTGHLTNLSTAPASGFAPADDRVFLDRFRDGWVVAIEPENRVEFLADGRFRMTDGTGSREGDYTYTRTGRHNATVVLDFDDGDRCTYRVGFASRLAGSHSYECDGGSSGESTWHVAAAGNASIEVAVFDLDAANGNAAGIAYADGRLYVPEWSEDRVYVYTTAGERLEDLDFYLDLDNHDAERVAHADGKLYVIDEEDRRVYAYRTTGDRAGPDFDLDPSLVDPDGITYGDGMFYVVDERFSDRVFAHTASGERAEDADFDPHEDNGGAAGIAYADGHLFVVDIFESKVFAYTTAGERDAALDFDLGEDNSWPRGIAHGGGSFYVVDREQVFVYTVNGGAAERPDLVIHVPPADRQVGAGASFTLEATVRNQGDGSAGATTVHYYRSADPTIATDDVAVGSAAVAVLGAAVSSRYAVEIKVPADSGTYYYGACVDAAEGESDTTNNCSAGVRVEVAGNGGPDLVVEDPLGGPGAWARHRFTLNATVRNRGDGRAAATVMRYYRSEDQTITTSDAEVGTATVAELAAGASAEYPIRVLAPAETGMYHYGACVDAPAGEPDGGNNCSPALAVEVTARVEGCSFGLDEDNDRPTGIAHANGVLYVLDDGSDRKVFAYALSGERDADSDLDLGDDVRSPHRVVAVDDRLYVLDDAYDRVRVYATSGGRVAGDDFDLDEDNRTPAGIAHADGTFYVADAFAGREVFAYSASGDRLPEADFHPDPYNSRPGGIAYAGGRFFVIDEFDAKVYAYGAAGERNAAFDFDLDPANADPAGIAHDGDRFLVVDDGRSPRVFAYPDASGAGDAQPCFREGETTIREIPENTPAGIDVGAPVTATGGDAVRYALGGTDAASFDIVAETGQIRTREGVVYDYETQDRYSVEVQATDNGTSDTIDVAIDLVDRRSFCWVDAELDVAASGGDGRLTVTWKPLANQGAPYARVLGYETELRRADEFFWNDRRTFMGRPIAGTVYAELDNDTEYEVRVRPVYAEDDCSWSTPVSGTPSADLAPADDRAHRDRFGSQRIGSPERNYRLLAPGRCRHTLDSVSLDADCTYERTAPDAGRIFLEFDDPSKGSCEVTLAYSSLTAGSFVDECFDAGVNTEVPFDRSFRMPTGATDDPGAVPRAPRTQEEFDVFAWGRADLVPGLGFGCPPGYVTCRFGSGQAYTIGRDPETGVPLFAEGSYTYENTGAASGVLTFRGDLGERFEMTLEFEAAGIRATISDPTGEASTWPGMPHLDLTLGAQTVLLPIPPSWSAAIAIEADFAVEESNAVDVRNALRARLFGGLGPATLGVGGLDFAQDYVRVGRNRAVYTVEFPHKDPALIDLPPGPQRDRLLELNGSTWSFVLTYTADGGAEFSLTVTKEGRVPVVEEGFVDFTGDSISFDAFPEELQLPDEAPQAPGEDLTGVEAAAAVSATSIEEDDLQTMLLSAATDYEPGDWLEPKDGGNQRMMIVGSGQASSAAALSYGVREPVVSRIRKGLGNASSTLSRFNAVGVLRASAEGPPSVAVTANSGLTQVTVVCMQFDFDVPTRGARYFSQAKVAEGSVQLCQKDCVLAGGDNIQGCVWACE